MKTIVWNNSFKRAFKGVIKRNPQLGEKIFSVLELLVNDPFCPPLKAHKLRGQLEGLWACWVESDGRIIYTFEQDNETPEELIVLIDIGTHDEVY